MLPHELPHRFCWSWLAASLLWGCTAGEIGWPTDDGVGGSGSGSGSGAGPPPVGHTRPVPLCQPSAGGPHWLEEEETLTATVSCRSGLSYDGDSFSFDELPYGASYEPTSATLSWTPDLTQAAVYELVVRAPALGESGTVKIGVADKWNDPDNTPVLDPTQYPEEYGLPVFFLSPAPQSSEAYAPTTIIYRGEVYDAEAKKRGASSLSYPKNSYTLHFFKEHRFNEPKLGGGLYDKRKIVLTTTFDDNAYVRQRLGFEMWNRLDPEHIQVQAYNAVVYLEGEYWGLYTVTDHIDYKLMAENGLWEDGNLYKARNHNCNFRLVDYQGNPKATLHDGYEKKHPNPEPTDPNPFADLDELVAFTGGADDAAFRDEIGDWIDQRDFQSWWVWIMFTWAADSGGKNSYLHHGPPEALWRVVPWDLNASFGQDWKTGRVGSSPGQNFTWPNGIWQRMLADPVLGGPLRARIAEAMQDEYALDEVLAMVDGYIAEIDMSARRDWEAWQDAYFAFDRWSGRTDFTSYDEEVAYLREWLALRWADLELGQF